MRKKIINFLKSNAFVLKIFYFISRMYLRFLSLFIRQKKKQILFASFGGRNFDDSPRALYDFIINDPYFNDYELIWCFVDPNKFDIPRGKKIKIDTFAFFKALVQSGIWISNSGMDRDIHYNRKNLIKIETWHGTPLKKICGEENENSIGGKHKAKKHLDNSTIRCAQSEYDQEIFARVFDSTKESILLSDLPRNDKILKYSEKEIKDIKNRLNIKDNKKVILYTPTYREYLIDKNSDLFIAPPIDFARWQNELGGEYVLLIRAHYAVSKALDIKDNDFVKDVSNYPCLNDLYIISDLMISDYSSTYFDYAILNRPMLCYAYDLDEYSKKRGLYPEISSFLPCRIDQDENSILDSIKNITSVNYSQVEEFHNKYAPFAGNASLIVISKLKERINSK